MARTGQICNACHAPHNPTNGSLGQLWNHTPSAVAGYTLYASGAGTTMDSTPGQPGGVSKLCLSCHDGTISINAFGGSNDATSQLMGTVASLANLGTDLSNDHPIGMTYDAALITADGALKGLATAVVIGSGAKTKSTTVNGLLYMGKVECASCHDVHNTFTADAGVNLVKVSTAGSAICLTCHDK